jgi:DNA-binding Lrp family transcriptional regulator
MLSELEKKVIAKIQGDMPVCARPYKVMADELGIDEDSLIEVLQGLSGRGVIRRFGATLRHQKSGYSANAMVAWNVPEEMVENVGEIFSAFAGVSHCYRRNPQPSWPYNLYTMIHAKTRDQCREMADKMAQQAGVADYTLLFSEKELKKTSMEYFPTDEDD